jgi:protein SCO1/2
MLREVPVPATENATILPQPRELPPLDLVDQDNRPLPRDFLRNRWTVVFFGFTQCPDVCPTTLATLAQMKKKLTDLPAEQQPRVLLVSVDPERDTAAILKPYVTFFDPSFLAATGTLAATGQAAKAFSVPFAKVPLPDGGYTMDHGAGLFVVSPKGALAAYASPPLDATVLARDFRKVVQYFEDSRR